MFTWLERSVLNNYWINLYGFLVHTGCACRIHGVVNFFDKFRTKMGLNTQTCWMRVWLYRNTYVFSVQVRLYVLTTTAFRSDAYPAIILAERGKKVCSKSRMTGLPNHDYCRIGCWEPPPTARWSGAASRCSSGLTRPPSIGPVVVIVLMNNVKLFV